ncbi:MAG: SDR family NAD(P)-dependent oxidoreductase [Cohaesibacteraceae bacterium]|nr:SDR family NAD(P)-dependent oxidoreductase [Cohaesibacteraceae bacterium]MBL4876238.1 SDR family NAD(P)-dependent oxidoreductase [Cohaesibacteraceae bacterium]
MDISTKTAAIVTGGASGLGESTARRLASLGAKVALFDLNVERGEKVASEIGGIFCQVDVTDEASVDAGFEKARDAHGVERILVNCAGIVAGRKTVSRDRDTGIIKSHDLATFTKVITINLIGSFHMIAKSAAGMAGLDPVTDDGGKGVIINTSSVAGTDGQIGQAAYAASKGGIMGLTLPVARDLAREGIRVATIMPGLFHTPMFDSIPDEITDALGKTVPFPSRLGKPKEYANLVAHIVDNDMINGTCLRLDGAIRLEPK